MAEAKRFVSWLTRPAFLIIQTSRSRTKLIRTWALAATRRTHIGLVSSADPGGIPRRVAIRILDDVRDQPVEGVWIYLSEAEALALLSTLEGRLNDV